VIEISPVSFEIGNDHVHTWRSDGELTELETILYALTNKLGRIELTDHDTVKAWSPGVIKAINDYICSGVNLFSDGETDPPNQELLRPAYVKYILTEGGFENYKLHAFHRIEPLCPGVLRCGPDLKIGQGVELTAKMGYQFHILGLNLKRVSKEFQARLDKVCEVRQNRAREMLKYLYERDYFFEATLDHLRSSKDPHFSAQQLTDLISDKSPITWEDVAAVNPDSPSRLTIGFLLWKRYGEALYSRPPKPGEERGVLTPAEVRDIYFERSIDSTFIMESISPREAIDDILRHGGIPLLAHPNEKRDEDDPWLESDFGVFQAKGVDVQKLLDGGVITEDELVYASKYGIMALFCEWGIHGIEGKGADFYVSRHDSLRVFQGTDYHGPDMKPKQKIKAEKPLISTDSLLSLPLIKEVHNELLRKMRDPDNLHYTKWRESYARTMKVIDSFPPPAQRTPEQSQIIDSLPQELEKMPQLRQYLEKARVYESHPPYFGGTVFEMALAVRNQVQQMVSSNSYLNSPNDIYNQRISTYLSRRLGNHRKVYILQEHLPLLHNIGKVLTFGVDEVEVDGGKKRYMSTFVQHDMVGAEFIESIRPVLSLQEFADVEIDHISDVTLYHVIVHNGVYKAMDALCGGKGVDEIRLRARELIGGRGFKPDVILDSLLLIRAAGKMAYARDLSRYDNYTLVTDELMKISLDITSQQ